MKVISIILGGAALALSPSLWASTNTNLSTTQLQSQQVKSFVENSYAGKTSRTVVRGLAGHKNTAKRNIGKSAPKDGSAIQSSR